MSVSRKEFLKRLFTTSAFGSTVALIHDDGDPVDTSTFSDLRPRRNIGPIDITTIVSGEQADHFLRHLLNG